MQAAQGLKLGQEKQAGHERDQKARQKEQRAEDHRCLAQARKDLELPPARYPGEPSEQYQGSDCAEPFVPLPAREKKIRPCARRLVVRVRSYGQNQGCEGGTCRPPAPVDGDILCEEHSQIAHSEGRHQRVKHESESKPEQRPRGLSFQPTGQRPEDRERRQRPRRQVFIDDVKGGSRHRQGKQAGQQNDATPGCEFPRKAQAADPPRAQQQQIDGARVHQQQYPVQRKMRYTDQVRDDDRKHGESRLPRKQMRIVRIEGGIESMLDRWNVDFSVFHVGVVTMKDYGCQSEQQEEEVGLKRSRSLLGRSCVARHFSS